MLGGILAISHERHRRRECLALENRAIPHPTAIYGVMMLGQNSRAGRVAAGVSYTEMLKEFAGRVVTLCSFCRLRH